MRGRSFAQRSTAMNKDDIVYLRDHAHALVKLARKIQDATVAGELEAMAIELLERAREMEKGNSF
jgi:hypothetical protein